MCASDLALASAFEFIVGLGGLGLGFVKAPARCVRVGQSQSGVWGVCLRLRTKEIVKN